MFYLTARTSKDPVFIRHVPPWPQEDFVTAGNLWEALWRMLRDARSEAPDVINAIHRRLERSRTELRACTHR
jgi:hypothetical protein